MKRSASCLAYLAFLSCQPLWAQVAPFSYRLGALSVTEDANGIRIDAQPPATVSILPGGHTWPLLTLDEQGNAYVGHRSVNLAQPRVPQAHAAHAADESTVMLPYGYRITALERAFRIVRAGTSCTLDMARLGMSSKQQALESLKRRGVVFSPSADGRLLALTTRLGADKSETHHVVADIDLAACRVRRKELGNPDLLVELAWSSGGGWWVTGSIEQTLLQSYDGQRWRPVPLPGDISSLTSAYIVDARNIWLAGRSGDIGDTDPLIIHSSDGGRTWKNISRTDPLLTQLPVGWLEGWRRLGQSVQH